MTATWDERIESYWATVDETQPEVALRETRALVIERPENDPEALYEWASIHDYLGMEAPAVPLYRAALDHGLTGARKPQAINQLASSLRNIGESAAAVEVLSEQPNDEITGDAAQAFLALALRDGGQHDQALRVALVALARTLPLYGGGVENYAQQLTSPHSG